MNSKAGKIFIGEVLSDKMQNTIVVALEHTRQHPIYKKTVTHHTRIYSENNLNAKTGQIVKVRETRPLSKLKRFTTLEIIK